MISKSSERAAKTLRQARADREYPNTEKYWAVEDRVVGNGEQDADLRDLGAEHSAGTEPCDDGRDENRHDERRACGEEIQHEMLAVVLAGAAKPQVGEARLNGNQTDQEQLLVVATSLLDHPREVAGERVSLGVR